MKERQFRKSLWDRFFLLANDAFETLISYLTFEKENPFYGKIFKLDIICYEEEHPKRIIGIKMFPDNQIFVRVEFQDTQIQDWVVFENGNEYMADSVSRLDLIMKITNDVEYNHKEEQYWVSDDTDFNPPPPTAFYKK